MNLRDIAKKVGSYINSKTQDDKGFFQQGKFEPLKAISNISTPTGTLGQNFQEIRSMGTQAFNPYQGIAENKNNNAFLRGGADIVNQGLKQFTNTSTLGLVQPQMGERQTKAGLIGAIGGGVAGFAANPFGKVMGSTDKLVSKIAPKAVGLAPKLIKGLGSEALQTLGYSSASLLGNKLGLNQRTGQFTKGNLTQDFLMGSVMRGGLGAVENLVGGTGNLKVKGFSMDNLTKDELVKAEDMLLNPSNYLEQRTFTTTRLKNKIEKEQIKKIQAEAFDTIGRLSAKYLPNSVFTKLEGNPKAQIKALIDLSSQNKLANVQMGIVDNSKLNKEISPIKTGGEDLLSEAKKYKSAEEFVSNQISKEKGFRDSQLAPNTNDYSINDVFSGKSNQPKDILTIDGLKKYGNESFGGKETIEAINNARKTGKITIYRAVPKDVTDIGNGEWVYLAKNQADSHGLNRLGGDYKVLSKEVNAKDIYWDGTDIREWGYDSGTGGVRQTKYDRMEELRNIWKKANEGNIQQPKNIEEKLKSLKEEARFLEKNSEWDKLAKVQQEIESISQPSIKGGERYLDLPRDKNIPYQPIDAGNNKIIIFRGARSPKEAELLKQNKFNKNTVFNNDNSIPMTTDLKTAQEYGSNFYNDYLSQVEYNKSKGYPAPRLDEGGGVHAFLVDKNSIKPLTSGIGSMANENELTLINQAGSKYLGEVKNESDVVKLYKSISQPSIKVSEQPKIKVSNLETPKQPELKQRGFSASVQEAPDITKKTKIKVLGGYETKSNDVLMGEAKALLTQGGTIKDVKNVQNIDQKITAAMQEAINLDAQGQHEAAANLFNNLSDIGTELGRGVQSYSLLQKMSPQAIALSAAGKIKKYNQTAKVKIPELTGQQQKVISDQVNSIINLPDGREKNIALNQLENTINSFIPSSKTDKFLTVWKAGLLTSIRTHARNIVGNTIMQGSEMMSNVPGSFADRLMALRTGQRTLTPSVQGTLQGTKEGFSQAGDIMKYGFDPTETIQKFDIKKVNWGNTPTQKAMKAYTDFVFNSLSAEDKPFYQSSYVRSLYNQASAAAINAGKSGDAKYIKNLVDNATEQMKTIATNDANYATFKDKNALSKLASAFKQSTNGKWYTKLPAEIVAPFTQVPSSMVQKTFDYSPIGLIKGIKDAGKVITQNVPDLQRQAAQEIGRGTIGTGIFALGSYLMAKGLMTGQPKDDAERKQWELEGKQQNSILINGKWRSINSVGPQTLILLAGAKYDEEMNDPEGSMAQYGIGLVQDQLNQTFLSGVQQPLQAITDPQRYGKSYVGGQVASFVPNIVKDTAKAFDPVARETDTGSMMGNIKTSVQSGIPGWRNQMTPKRDTLGNILKQEPTGLGAYVDLFNSKTPISNTVVDELSRLNNAGFNATPSKLGTSQTISGIKVKLDQKSLDKYEETAGKAVSSALESLFASNSYQKLDDQSKQETIDDVVSKERKKVRANMNLSWTPDMGYTKSTDSPTGISRVGLYGKSVITDPKQTIKAVLDGNPIRKVEGGTVILERKNSLGSLDQGNKATEVDHKIALTLGGTNKEDNLQVLTKEENRIKGAFETYLYKEMKAGRITKEEAQKRDLNWREEVGKIPQSEQTKIVEGLESEAVDTSSGKVYKLVGESGTVTTIDLSKAIEEPKLTGFTEVDKKLKSSYKSAITTRINNIVKLYEDGQLSAEEAEKYIKELKAKSTGTGSTKSKGGKITIKAPKYNIPKISVKFQETPSTIKLKSAPKIKVSSSNQRRYTIKA